MFIVQSSDILPPNDDSDERIVKLNAQITSRDVQIQELKDSIQKLNEDRNVQIEELNSYIQNLITERNTYSKIISNQSHIYEDSQNLLNEIQNKLDQRQKSNDTDPLLNEYSRTKDETLDQMRHIQRQIKESGEISDLNLEIEVAYFKELQKTVDLQMQIKYLTNQLKLARDELKLEENINRQLSESANKIKEYINQITSIINSSQVIEDSKRQEIEYYTKTIDSLSGEMSQLKNQLELSIKRYKDQEVQIYALNRSLKYYESLNNSNSSTDPILEYICKVYSTIYQSEASIIEYINKSEVSKEYKNVIIDFVRKIREDQYMRQVNLNIIAYITKTQELRKYLLSLTSIDANALKGVLDKYLEYVRALNLSGGSIGHNNTLISKFIGQITNKKYNINNIKLDSHKLSESINVVYVDDIKLDIKQINFDNKNNISDNLLQKQINLLLNLIILFNISEITKDRQNFEDHLESYNYYANILSKISRNKYDTYVEIPNNKILENFKTKININIREYINAIGRNSNEHASIAKLGINFKDICGDNSSVNIKHAHKAVVNAENILKKEVSKLTHDIVEILKHIELAEIYVILELFSNKV